MKQIVVVFSLGCLVVGAAMYWFLSPNKDSTDGENSTESAPVVSVENIEADGQTLPETGIGESQELVSIDEDQELVPNFLRTEDVDPAIWELRSEWNRQHGYLGSYDPNLHSYGSLDNNTLVALRDSGDVMAATMLARRLRHSSSEEDREQAADALRHAAAMGSTFSMVLIGADSRRSLATSDSSARTLLESRANEGAWYLLAMESGDPAGHMSFQSLVDSYSGNTEELIDSICEKRSVANEDIDEIRERFGIPVPEVSIFPGLAAAIKDGDVPAVPSCLQNWCVPGPVCPTTWSGAR